MTLNLKWRRNFISPKCLTHAVSRIVLREISCYTMATERVSHGTISAK